MSGPLTRVKVYGQNSIDSACLHGVVGFHPLHLVPAALSVFSLLRLVGPSGPSPAMLKFDFRNRSFAGKEEGRPQGEVLSRKLPILVRPVCSSQARQVCVCVCVGLKCISLGVPHPSLRGPPSHQHPCFAIGNL